MSIDVFESCTAEQVSSGDAPAIHSYFDLCPESPDGNHVAYFAFRHSVPGNGRVHVVETSGRNDRPVGPELYASAHTAVKQQWAGNTHVVYGRGGGNGLSTVLLDILSGAMREIPGAVRMASADGRFGVTSSHEARCLECEPDPVESVYHMDFESGKLERLFTREDAVALHPLRDEVPDDETRYMAFKHTKIAPDGKRFFVVFHNEGHFRDRADMPTLRSPRIKSLFTCGTDGTGLRYLSEFGHHPFWSPDSKEVWAAGRSDSGDGQDVTAVDADDGTKRVVVRNVRCTHSSLHPDGSCFVADQLRHPEPNRSRIVRIDIATGNHRVLAEVDTPDLDHATGTHPHPVWSRDGSSVYFNAAPDRVPHLYRLEVTTDSTPFHPRHGDQLVTRIGRPAISVKPER